MTPNVHGTEGVRLVAMVTKIAEGLAVRLVAMMMLVLTAGL